MFNWFKTAILMAGITALFIIVGGMIGVARHVDGTTVGLWHELF